MSPEDKTRRNVLKGGMLAAGAAAAPSFVLPALAQGERLVPFTDVPDSFQVRPVQPDTTHWQDTRKSPSLSQTMMIFISCNIMVSQRLIMILGAFELPEWSTMNWNSV